MADTTPEVRPALGIPLFDRYDPRIVQEMAIGTVDEEIDILARYRITGSAAEQLLTDPILRTEVVALTQELKRAGTTAKIKSRFVAEEIIGKLWEKVRQGAHTTGELLDVLKVLAKIGDLEPREAGGKLTGTIVRVDLNIENRRSEFNKEIRPLKLRESRLCRNTRSCVSHYATACGVV